MNTDKNVNSVISISSTLIIGFALFASFFGAGNLIFPPVIGLAAGKNWIMALIGFALSGVLLPVLSFAAVVRSGGNEEGIASEMGRVFSLLFISVIMLCTSLLIAVPRTAATTHELGIVTIFGDISQVWTSSVFFLIVLYLSLNPSTVVETIGKYLTPALLIIMSVIIVKGIISPISTPTAGIRDAFRKGFVDGYQTLDVFGGLVFSGAVFAAVASHLPDNRRAQMKMAYGCAIVAGMGLLFVYGGLLYLGATGSQMMDREMEHAELIVTLIDQLFRSWGPIALAVATIFACLTTAIGLTAGASYFFNRVTQGKLPYKFNVTIICTVSFLFSNLGISAIIGYAVPILVFIYPTAIVLVLLNVFRCRFFNRGTFLGAAYSTLFFGFLEMLPILGVKIDVILSVMETFPFAAHGFVWAIPALICGVIGTVLYKGRDEGRGERGE